MELEQTHVPAATRSLLARCDAELLAAQFSADPADRFIHAHYAALRAAGAALEARGKSKVRGQTGNVWHLLACHIPELVGWSEIFAASARFRSALESGRFDLVDEARAELLLEASEDFRDAVRATLNLGTANSEYLQGLTAS